MDEEAEEKKCNKEKEHGGVDNKEHDTHILNHLHSVNNPSICRFLLSTGGSFYWMDKKNKHNERICHLIISPVARKEAVMLPATYWQSHTQAHAYTLTKPVV